MSEHPDAHDVRTQLRNYASWMAKSSELITSAEVRDRRAPLDVYGPESDTSNSSPDPRRPPARAPRRATLIGVAAGVAVVASALVLLRVAAHDDSDELTATGEGELITSETSQPSDPDPSTPSTTLDAAEADPLPEAMRADLTSGWHDRRGRVMTGLRRTSDLWPSMKTEGSWSPGTRAAAEGSGPRRTG